MMILILPNEHINELQRESVEKLLNAVKGSHYANITVRKGGQDYQFEADWLKHLRIAGEKPEI